MEDSENETLVQVMESCPHSHPRGHCYRKRLEKREENAFPTSSWVQTLPVAQSTADSAFSCGYSEVTLAKIVHRGHLEFCSENLIRHNTTHCSLHALC